MKPNCKNPFHYCEKLYDLSKQRRFDCGCSTKTRRKMEEKLPDIRFFLLKYPQQTVKCDYGLWRNRSRKTCISVPAALSQDDLIRKEHDRGKKRKKKNIHC